MLFFVNDYGEGAHEAVLDKLLETNLEKLPGYGTDKYSQSAKEKILAACECPDGDVFFLGGGTQTNAVVIASLLHRHQGVIAAETGHINVHEAGAIEYTGHKVLTLPEHEGKIDAGELRAYLEKFHGDETAEHMVYPGMVYISHPTEFGTPYQKAELEEIYSICQEYKLKLFMDGARLGYALVGSVSDLRLEDIAALTDVFYIGGTKVGALCGEAVVFPKGAPKHFITLVKQQGALLAKGRLVGIQFDALFTDDLYLKIGERAVKEAEKIRMALLEREYRLLIDSPTNQLFVILDNEKYEELSKSVAFSVWDKPDPEHTVVRICTSWATRDEDVEELIGLL